MEGIIPFIFKVISLYNKEEGQASFGGSVVADSDESSLVSSYVLLPSDSVGLHRDASIQQLCPAPVQADAVTTCTARLSPLRCSTLHRRA
ncbi:hypothetical protein U9M48_017165 [Paspalum notatum var. saurae]|uniref:Uncharacterized protein n=1 Tax=Paspalum notatum var. saurae TaxID=547442 RepID=A0AAQ3WNK3_PASNO